MSPGLFEYERDPAPGNHDGPHHPQHQHLQGGQGQDQEARELHNQPQVGDIVKYFNFNGPEYVEFNIFIFLFFLLKL